MAKFGHRWSHCQEWLRNKGQRLVPFGCVFHGEIGLISDDVINVKNSTRWKDLQERILNKINYSYSLVVTHTIEMLHNMLLIFVSSGATNFVTKVAQIFGDF